MCISENSCVTIDRMMDVEAKAPYLCHAGFRVRRTAGLVPHGFVEVLGAVNLKVPRSKHTMGLGLTKPHSRLLQGSTLMTWSTRLQAFWANRTQVLCSGRPRSALRSAPNKLGESVGPRNKGEKQTTKSVIVISVNVSFHLFEARGLLMWLRINSAINKRN